MTIIKATASSQSYTTILLKMWFRNHKLACLAGRIVFARESFGGISSPFSDVFAAFSSKTFLE